MNWEDDQSDLDSYHYAIQRYAMVSNDLHISDLHVIKSTELWIKCEITESMC